jgi:hypothetical protein
VIVVREYYVAHVVAFFPTEKIAGGAESLGGIVQVTLIDSFCRPNYA